MVYKGIGCVNLSVEPHFVRSKVSDELMELSKKYIIYGLCDDSVIVAEEGNVEFYGEIYKMCNRNIEKVG